MRCVCCDSILTDFECSVKHKETKQYLDTCLVCLEGLDIPYDGNWKLFSSSDVHEEETYDE